MGIADLVRYLKELVCYVFGWLILPVNPFSKPIENHQKSNGTVNNAVLSNKKFDVATYTEKSVHDTEIRDKLSALIDNGQDSDDDEKVSKFLRENNVDVNIGNANGQTLLHTAVRNGYANVVNLLLNNGAHINQKDNKGWTPLLIASQIGNDKIVDILLKNSQIDLNATVVDGKSSLYLASLNGHSKVVELLLNTGRFDINATDDWSSTPLYAASFHGNQRVVEILLQNGAKINSKMSALDVAIENGHKNIATILERYKN